MVATDALDAPRKLRFSEQFTDDISTLITTFTSDIIASYNKDPKVIINTVCVRVCKFFLTCIP